MVAVWQDKYQQTLAQLEALVHDQVVPALSYALFEGDQVWTKEQGWAQLQPTREALRPGMFYDLASLTKVLATTPVIAWLVQEGQLHWDDPVQKYLPELKGQSVTLRELLTHTAAIEGYIPHRERLNQTELLTALLQTEQFGPNAKRNICYTDLGLIFAGLIAERVTGVPIQTLATRVLFAPLGLASELTFRPQPKETVPTAITAHRGLLRGEVHDPKAAVLKEHCGSAGLFGTLTGVLTYVQALITTNLNGLLTPASVAMMFSDQTALPGEHHRAMGWKLFTSRGTPRHLIASHTGFTGTFLLIDQQTKQGLIGLTNRVHPTGHNQAYLARRDQLFATYLNEQAQLE